ncbi:MAG: hypothetical protein N3B01_05730 [Verrucomicrobiae bacterium]|nr:hypothetical protein [Verrucomicrobiae bacterium]
MQPKSRPDKTIRRRPAPMLQIAPERTTALGWVRFLAAATLFHAALLLMLTTIKIVVAVPGITAVFEAVPPPPAVRSLTDPFEPLRHYDYQGVRGGLRASSPATAPPSYNAAIASLDTRRADQLAGEVIGVRVDKHFAGPTRLEGVPGGLGAPFAGAGNGRFALATGFAGSTGFGHRAPAVRLETIRQQPGAEAATRAVVAALRWLKKQQQPDGSWPATSYRLGISALATLAFLGHGETPDSAEFGVTLTQAFRFLSQGFDPHGNLYEQALAAYALAEAYGMTRTPSLREPLVRRIELLLQAQQAPKTDPLHVGGWRYSIVSSDADTSVTGWCVQALTAARLAGIEVPQATLDAASQFLWNLYRDGSFGYQQPGGTTSTTAIGVLCLMLLGHGHDPRIGTALEKLKPVRFDWEKTEAPLGMVLHQWYYLTQVFFQAGGNYWKNWNEQFRETLLRQQADDGHWELPAMSKEKEFNVPPVYSTALCALMLEVYYRYLPTYRALASKPQP